MRPFIAPAAHFLLRAFLFVSLYAALASLLVNPAAAAAGRAGNSGSAAYVYVGAGDNSGNGYVIGYSVASDGSAQPVPGSPLNGASQSLVGAGHSLFATDGKNIVTYAAAPDGSLSESSSVDGTAYDLDRQTSGVGALSLTPDGHNLYTDEWYFDGANNAYLSWRVGENGQLSYLPSPTSFPPYSTAGGWPFSFTADSRYAYTWSMCRFDGQAWGFARLPDGGLTQTPMETQGPPPQQGQEGSQCSQAVAVSTLGYAAIAWNGDFCCGGPPLIAAYAISGDGELQLVPGSEQAISCTDSPMTFDPSGRYLAVACNGIQVYELGAQGQLATVGSPVDTSIAFSNLGWDASNHLYAITDQSSQLCQSGDSACGLYIFNSSAGVLSLAPGSPYSMAQPGSLAVLSEH
jgi:hypothetical protein